MEMQQVRYFVALAGTLNFTRAAEQCNVSQPALTRAIQQLEHELGGPLFHRERGNTHLSELGRMMLPYLQTVEESARAARDQARAVKKLERATLTIGTMCTIGPQLVSDLLVRFQAQHPDVEVQVVDAGAPQMIEMLEKGELEVAIVGVPGELPEALHQLPIFEERFVILLPPNHHLVASNPVRAEQLDTEPYVSRSNCEVFEPVRKELNSRGVFMRQVFSSPRDDWVQGMIKAGLGIGFFPEFSVTDPDLVVRPLVEPSFHRTIYLATVRGRPHSPAVGAFVQEARRYPWPKTRLPLATASETIVVGQQVMAIG
jgi:DNA-binding transcriptional LysR family regulator